jgi:hypothetical protein
MINAIKGLILIYFFSLLKNGILTLPIFRTTKKEKINQISKIVKQGSSLMTKKETNPTIFY